MNLPLVSIIIPCYNYGFLLFEAIESVLKQSYIPIEIIVIDDGSSDNTKEVAKRFSNVKYFFQKNQGLSSARNLGIVKSSGEFLVFLDADDLLFPYSIEYNVRYLQSNNGLAFVSGAYQVTNLDNRKLGEKKEIVTHDHYIYLLKSNYIGMLATVMFKRFIFNEYCFDTNLRACEDYDIYLKIARNYPVAHHTKLLTSYRMHDTNMSGNNALMLKYGLEVLSRQKLFLKSSLERNAYLQGFKNFKSYYTTKVFLQLSKQDKKYTKDLINILKKYNYLLYLRLNIARYLRKSLVKRFIPENGLRLLHKFGVYKSYSPSHQSIRMGDFVRTSPFSKSFGYDRGGPIDRYYIEQFLEEESYNIKGRVLEIGDNEYTLRFGKNNVQQSDILHVNDNKSVATIIGDLSDAPHIPDNSFDCVILTQTLHLIYDYKAVINTCQRILKPAGSLLLTVPGITPIDYGEWGSTWYWSFTGLAIQRILDEYSMFELVEVKSFGNVYVASTFLFGMGLPELKKELLEFNDPQMQVIVAAKAIKKS